MNLLTINTIIEYTKDRLQLSTSNLSLVALVLIEKMKCFGLKQFHKQGLPCSRFRNYSTLLNENSSERKPISLYFHWPFCQSICSYCDFNRYKRDANSIANLKDPNAIGSQMMKTYMRVLDDLETTSLPALSNKQSIVDEYELVSIFFGGGTPSTMNPKLMEQLIGKSLEMFKGRDVEISMEANPTSIEMEKMRDFHSAGVNRVSVGVQSFDPECLKTLGREHSVGEALNAINTAKNIFNNRVSIDLMFGLPQHKQKPDLWKTSLQQALSLDMNHISLYQLTIEKGTKFQRLFNIERDLPNEEESSYLYDYTIDVGSIML